MLRICCRFAGDNREEQAALVTGSSDTLTENTVLAEKIKPPTRKPSVEKIEENPQESTSIALPKLQEPDVIASTKNSNSFIRPDTQQPQCSSEQAPIAPPRRKKKLKAALQQSVSVPLQCSDSVSEASCKVGQKTRWIDSIWITIIFIVIFRKTFRCIIPKLQLKI